MGKGYVYHHVVTPLDTTVWGFAYDMSYLEWASIARERMIVEYVDMERFSWPMFLTGEAYLHYQHPAYLNDRIEVWVTMEDLVVEKGRAKLSYRFINHKSQQVLAVGYHILFFADPDTGKRVPIPPEFMELAEKVNSLES